MTHAKPPRSSITPVSAAFALILCTATGGCLQRDLKELNPCLVSGVSVATAVAHVDKVDLLFIVDDSKSMAQEQASLRREFPKLVNALTSGRQVDALGNVRSEFPAVTDLHLGVVSTDMGLVGVRGVESCGDGFGADGKLQNTGNPDIQGCDATYPSYLQFRLGDDAAAIADDFQCVASLGTAGCGYEQPLEAGLKALWPALDIDRNTGSQWVDPSTGQPGNRVSFLRDATGNGQFGHGDGYNAGFVRDQDAGGASLIGIVLVTDEEDCSSADTEHFRPASALPADDPLKQQPNNLRCFHNKGNLYGVERYINGLKALRPGLEHLVVFAAIAGVPTDLVQLRDTEGNPLIDLGDERAREQWYDEILSDDRMVERIDETQPVVAKRNLTPSCKTANGKAYPPRRIVEVAEGFGPNGIVQSICQDDFSGAMDAIIEIIASQLGAVCLPRQLYPDSEGTVGCEVLWELPTQLNAAVGVPTRCDEREFLLPPAPGTDTIGASGGNLCRVAQLRVAPADRRAAKADAITDDARRLIVERVRAAGDGWFYDDFSGEVLRDCPSTGPQRITFTDAAKPPNGVTVSLECLSEKQSLTPDYPRLDVAFYEAHHARPVMLGDPCAAVPDGVSGKASYYDGLTRAGEPQYESVVADTCATDLTGDCTQGGGAGLLNLDVLCRVRTAAGQFDERMFCDLHSQQCVRGCTGDDGCPPAWVCDEQREVPICINPTCGD